jgi:hypothetical protein
MRRAWIAVLLAARGLAQTIEGTASNSATGQPLDGVKISVESGGKTVGEAATDAQGVFRLEGLAAGEYRALFSKRGFEAPPRDDAARKPFVLTGGQAIHLEIRMTPMAKISGRVLDGSGTPVAQAFVQVLGGRAGYDDTTDAQGKFAFDEIPPGTYRLWARAPKGFQPPQAQGGERMAWVPTFYPGVAEASGAARLDLEAGSEMWDQEIRLQSAPVHAIRGVVFDPGGRPAAKLKVLLGSDQGTWFRDENREISAVTDERGAFIFEEVTDGMWRVSAEAGEGGGKLRAFAAESVAGHDVNRVELRLSGAFTVHGTVVREGAGAASKPAPMLVILAPDGGGSVFHQGAPDADGRFTIEGVHAGRYTVRPISPGPPFYLAAIRIGEREVPYQEPVDLLPGALPVTVVYRTNGGGVRGSVEDCGAATVVFYPADAGLQVPEFTRRATCGERGRFEISNMRPGEYYGLAFDQPPGLDAMFFGFTLDQGLINRAVRVTVRAGEFSEAELRVTRRQ